VRRWCELGILLAGAAGCSRSSAHANLADPAPAAVPGAAGVLRSAQDDRKAVALTPVAAACGDPGDVSIFTTPERAVAGRPVRVVAVSDRMVDAGLTIKGAGTTVAEEERHGGPPYFWVAKVDAAARGKYVATLARTDACGGAALLVKEFAAHEGPLPPPTTPRTSIWRTRTAWSPGLEDLYAAWVQFLFEAPLDAAPSWSALHEVLRDRERNFLFDHQGAAEDEQGVVVRPDCADLPYFLRAYFAYKLGLPFGWSRCTRGENGVAPTCFGFATSSDPFPAVDGGAPVFPPWADPLRDAGAGEVAVKRLGEFFRTTLADAAQSGAGRTRADDDESDYYPVVLTADTLRPGTIFADPYGHVLVVAKRLPQTPSSGGVLLAVDGQPDGTVARKRFWRGNFLFAIDPALGSAGFKRFRPLVRDPATGGFRRLRNAELADFSATDQYEGGVEGFYDKIDDLLSPTPLDPMQALLETVQALEEQVKTRVTSVDNGRRFLAGGKGAAGMPDGAKIFETTGDWEDFSTPSRDLRLLVAIDVAHALPARVARRSSRYAMPPGKTADQVGAELDSRLEQELRARTFQYTRTDGSSWQLTLREVVDRATALETAYNPNDCVEARWGAPDASEEGSTCHAHAPAEQVAKMQDYRSWFHERRRPPR
jgi:hypothetical protein